MNVLHPLNNGGPVLTAEVLIKYLLSRARSDKVTVSTEEEAPRTPIEADKKETKSNIEKLLDGFKTTFVKGSTINACVLNCLIDNFQLKNILEQNKYLKYLGTSPIDDLLCVNVFILDVDKDKLADSSKANFIKWRKSVFVLKKGEFYESVFFGESKFLAPDAKIFNKLRLTPIEEKFAKPKPLVHTLDDKMVLRRKIKYGTPEEKKAAVEEREEKKTEAKINAFTEVSDVESIPEIEKHTEKELTKLTMIELRKIAKKLGVESIYGKNKKSLIEGILKK